jgi:hypothetical protein
MSAALKLTARDRLAEAIAENDERRSRVKAIEKGLEELRVRRYSLTKAVNDAKEKLEESKRASAKDVADRAMGYASESFVPPKEAQAALTEAEERSNEVESAYQALKQEHVGATQDRAYGEHVLRRALTEALSSAPEVQKLLARFDAARAEVAALHSTLLVISGRFALPNGWDNQKVYSDLGRASEWQLAIDRLEKDANAPLPK